MLVIALMNRSKQNNAAFQRGRRNYNSLKATKWGKMRGKRTSRKSGRNVRKSN